MSTQIAIREQRAADVTVYVARYHDVWGYSPSLREIRAALDLSSTSVAADWVRDAVELGYIAKPPDRRTRSLRVTDAGLAAIVGMETPVDVVRAEACL